MDLIDSDRLFQQLFVALEIPGAKVAADLDVDSMDNIPFVTHHSTISRTGNADVLWETLLTVNVFIEISTATFATIKTIYEGIHSWDRPDKGIIPGVGAVENVVRDIEAFTRRGAAVNVLDKAITQYTGSFELTLRNRPI